MRTGVSANFLGRVRLRKASLQSKGVISSVPYFSMSTSVLHSDNNFVHWSGYAAWGSGQGRSERFVWWRVSCQTKVRTIRGREQKKGATQRRFTPYCQVCLKTTVQMAIKFCAHLATSSRTCSQRLAQTDRWSFTGYQPSLLLTGGLWK